MRSTAAPFASAVALMVGTVTGGTRAAAGPRDLVLLDPPYDFDGWDDLLATLEGLMTINGVVVVESAHEVDTGTGWHVDSSRRAAGTVVTLLRPESDPA